MKDRKKVITIALVILAVWFVIQCVFNEQLYKFTTNFKQGLIEISRKANETNELKKDQTDITEAEAANTNLEVTAYNADPTATNQVQETEPEVVTTTDLQANEAPPIEENALTLEPVKDIGDENQNTFTSETLMALPESIMSTVEYWKTVYPNMTIGVGLYSLDGTKGYEYNSKTLINSACTIKAAYALYVLKECERRGIDIWSTFLTYQEWHSDPDGSGDIQLYASYGAQYSIADLVRLLLQVSDNVAYNMLLEQFPLNEFYVENSALGGQSDWSKWGKASVQQRKNEWLEIWNYVNSSAWYAQVLREDLTGTQYAYFLQGMQNWHNYMQKSGWTEENPEYPATCEAAIIDDSYLLVVLSEDYSDYKMGHIDVLQSIGGAVENFWNTQNGYY